MSNVHEEEALGKAYDARIMRRLLEYLRPYRWRVVLAMALVAVVTPLELAPPMLFRTAIDKYFTPAGPEHWQIIDELRQSVANQGAWANIKPTSRRVNIPAFSPFLYRYRNLVERFFSKLKHFRAVATRFEKQAANYLALVKLAASRIWMRFMSR